MWEERLPTNVMHWSPPERRRRGRPTCKWKMYIKSTIENEVWKIVIESINYCGS
jgi:hypothetical protein